MQATSLAKRNPPATDEPGNWRDEMTTPEVMKSITDADRERIHQMAVEADCIREIEVQFRSALAPQRVRYYVPPTDHWAGWRDEDAIRYHGMRSLGALIERFHVLSDEPWDGTYQHLWSVVE